MRDQHRPRVFAAIGDNFEVKRGICDYAREHGPWQVVFRDTRLPRHFLEFQSIGFDGAVAWFLDEDFDPVDFRDLTIPVVNTNEFGRYRGVTTVCVDSPAAATRAAEHLLERGLRSFGYFGPTQRDLFVTSLRRDAFAAAVARAGAACSVLEFDRLWHHDRLDAEIAEIADWMTALPKPCGVLAFADAHALFVLEAARRAGLRVPHQVAVIGVDNHELHCEFALPALTSVDPDFRAVGYRAAALLAELMAGRPDPRAEVRVPVRGVVARASTNVLAHGDADVSAAWRYIHDHAAAGVTVDRVVREVGVSRSALVAKFTRLVGQSPKAEITRVRIDRARALLADTDWPVFRIATETGFASDAHFCRVFRAETGTTPKAYRDQSRGNAKLEARSPKPE